MDDRSAGDADPPLTRRELRRREEAACALLPAQESWLEQLPVPGPAVPAAAVPRPRSSASGRVPQWAIDEANGIPVQDSAWRGSVTTPYAPAPLVQAAPHRVPGQLKRFFRGLGRAIRSFFKGLWSLTKLVVGTSLVVIVLWNAVSHFAPEITAQAGKVLASNGLPTLRGIPGITGSSIPGGAPVPGLETSNHPLGVPAPTADPSTSYAFLQTGEDQPFVSYDPCRPIHYVTRPQNAPAGGDAIITEAIAAASSATGFVFINDGTTTEAPAENRTAYQLARYGDRWAPVLFGWQSRAEESNFTHLLPGTETILGIGGSISQTSGAESSFVSGQVRLNAAALASMSTRPDGHDQIRAVIEHELGHVLGLGHVADPTQLMSPISNGKITQYAAGDLTGLAVLGKGKCRPGV